MIPPDEWSVSPSQRPLTDNTHLKETDIHGPAGVEPAIPASERPLTHALDSAAIRDQRIVQERNKYLMKIYNFYFKDTV